MDDYDDSIDYKYIKYPNVDIIYNIDSIIDKIKTCKDRNEIKQIILYQHDKIFTYTNLANKNIDGIKELFMDRKFLETLDDISGILSTKLSENEKIFINKIIYDYSVYSKNINNEEVEMIKQIMSCIAYTINRDLINDGLVNILGSYKESTRLAIIRRSGFKIDKIIHKVNMFIYRTFLTEGQIASIYHILYGDKYTNQINIELFTSIFINSMLEYIDEDKHDNFSTQFNIVSEILFDMFCSLNLYDIERLLINYNVIIQLYGIDTNKLRFSIKEHSNEKLLEFIKNIEERHNIEIY
jgi:hypothetical protein